MSSYSEKLILVRVALREGVFHSSGLDVKEITRVPLSVKIEKLGPPDFSKATVTARGLLMEDMEQMSTLAMAPIFRTRNLIQVYAGDSEASMHLAFSGDIADAHADMNSSPDPTFVFDCQIGYFGSLEVQSPTAIQGTMQAAQFISAQASRMGFQFRNLGVTAPLTDSVLSGSPMEQAQQAAREVGAELLADDGVLTLSPAGGPPVDPGRHPFLLSKDTGLLGYPTIGTDGIHIRSLYHPDYRLGEIIELQSLVPRASGLWRIIKLSHNLTAFDPSGGPWESEMTTFYPALSGPGGAIVGGAR